MRGYVRQVGVTDSEHIRPGLAEEKFQTVGEQSRDCETEGEA